MKKGYQKSRQKVTRYTYTSALFGRNKQKMEYRFMTAQQRNDIEKKIQELEPGRFQEFILKLLPLYNERYDGMRRNGHTNDGKTCRGVPDLIKTYNNGDQIGCECGTDKKYWYLSKKKHKPIEDLKKCLSKLTQPIEIVLASNRPMPPSNPNVINEIISHCPNKNCKITILSSEDLACWIEANDEKDGVIKLAEDFFPDIAKPTCKFSRRYSYVSKMRPEFPIKNVLVCHSLVLRIWPTPRRKR